MIRCFAVLFFMFSIAEAYGIDSSSCHGDAECMFIVAEEEYKFDCVDRKSAIYLGEGSMSLAEKIGNECLSAALQKYHPKTSLADVKTAEANAPRGVMIDLIGKIPGVGESGPSGLLTIRAQENFDCHFRHPIGEGEVVCNKPIDQNYIEEEWPYFRDEFGTSRSAFDERTRRESVDAEERHNRLRALAARLGR